MKIPKKLEPLLSGLFDSIIIGILSFLSFETSTGFWLMFSFGSSTLIVLVFHESEFAQPSNVFFGHLLAIVTNWKNEPAEKGGNILATSNKILHKKILTLLKPFAKK